MWYTNLTHNNSNFQRGVVAKSKWNRFESPCVGQHFVLLAAMNPSNELYGQTAQPSLAFSCLTGMRRRPFVRSHSLLCMFIYWSLPMVCFRGSSKTWGPSWRPQKWRERRRPRPRPWLLTKHLRWSRLKNSSMIAHDFAGTFPHRRCVQSWGC